SRICRWSFKHTSELLNRQDSEIEIVGGPLENTSLSELLKRHPLENSDAEFVGDPLENSSKIRKR
ncbi:12725_t:CDS:1, partial [Gigaspora rosea]